MTTLTQILSLPWLSTHRRRIAGAPGLPVLSPPLQHAEIAFNDADSGGLTGYYGKNTDGSQDERVFAQIDHFAKSLDEACETIACEARGRADGT